MRKLIRLSLSAAVATCVLMGLLVFLSLMLGCSEEECLVWGENCTQAYLQAEYGTTDIYCCEGQCADHGSGILTCGS
jgi:hypothetical protein